MVSDTPAATPEQILCKMQALRSDVDTANARKAAGTFDPVECNEDWHANAFLNPHQVHRRALQLLLDNVEDERIVKEFVALTKVNLTHRSFWQFR